ncbi:helix-turn-helix domain-containing protein [Castellaniella sp.]|uniref:helix-turn-helix domain-containing protein n=1 Tax=Castellaniella sp. TaxID=1955812 RepID=UPI002AFF9E59|nr:helix-turn-helix domain-containing protein [Castellaniella sp.]
MPLLSPVTSLRHYDGQAHAHEHDHVQIMVPLNGRMELDINGRASFTDSSCGLIIPAGARHAYQAQAGTRILVIDAPESAGLDKLRRFALSPACRQMNEYGNAQDQLNLLLGLPTVLSSRRGLDLNQLDTTLAQSLHQPWNTTRMAEMFHLSVPRFRARLLELTGQTPGHYLRAMRLQRATRLITQGISLEACAAQVGYRSASALAYALRRDLETSARRLRLPIH